MKRQEKSEMKTKATSTRTQLLYSTVQMLRLRYLLAETLKDVTVATTRGRKQGDPKASELRPRELCSGGPASSLSYFFGNSH